MRQQANVLAASAEFSVSFPEPGSLGLTFVANNEAGTVEILGVNAGTQAENHAELRSGLTLVSVGDKSVVGMPYIKAIEALKEASRPVTCAFK